VGQYLCAVPIPLRTRAFWAIYRQIERSPVMQQPPEKVRAASDRRKKMVGLPGMWLITGRPDHGASISDTSLKLDDGTELPLRIYRPRESGIDPLPVIVNFHGGGWVSGDARQCEWWCAGIAARAGVVIVSVDYRLAPEHAFPIPGEDCYATTTWVAEHADELGVDGSRLAVMGDSAGGNLAAVVALMAREQGGPDIKLQVLIYPSVDLDGERYLSSSQNANAPVLTSKDMDNTPLLYLRGSGADLKDPHASPLFADHHDLPPALIQTAQFDPLRDQGVAYAAALRDAGVEVRLTNYVDSVHGFISLPGVAAGGRQAMDEAVQTIRRYV
jgi:acetyl esterase